MTNGQTRRVDVSLVEGMHFTAVGADGISVSVDSPPEFGGVRAGPSPMEMLLVGLGGCTGMEVISILRKKRQNVTGYRVTLTATVAEEYPHVYTHIAIHHAVEGNGVKDEAVRRAIELSETKYCGAYAMLAKAAELTTTYEVLAARVADGAQ